MDIAPIQFKCLLLIMAMSGGGGIHKQGIFFFFFFLNGSQKQGKIMKKLDVLLHKICPGVGEWKGPAYGSLAMIP